MNNIFLKKYAQDAPPSPGGDAGAPPSPAPGPPSPPPPLPGGGGPPPSGGPGEGAPQQAASMVSENNPDQIFYKPLENPSDVLNDYKLEDALKSGISPEQIAQDIWTEYGGDDSGIASEPGRHGSRKKENSPTDPKLMDEANKKTENHKWLRLKEGLSIVDIFKNEMTVLKFVQNYTMSEIKLKKPPATSSAVSWYKYATKKS